MIHPVLALQAAKLTSGSEGAETLLAGWRLTVSPVCYLIGVAVSVLLVRAVLCSFKAFAMKHGEHLSEGQSDPSQSESWLKRFRVAFAGFAGHQDIRDYWLPAVIGFAELSAYPILLRTDQLVVIGGWLAIKTAGQWRGWERSRTAFNRFLVGNLLALGLAYLWLSQYVESVAA